MLSICCFFLAIVCVENFFLLSYFVLFRAIRGTVRVYLQYYGKCIKRFDMFLDAEVFHYFE